MTSASVDVTCCCLRPGYVLHNQFDAHLIHVAASLPRPNTDGHASVCAKNSFFKERFNVLEICFITYLKLIFYSKTVDATLLCQVFGNFKKAPCVLRVRILLCLYHQHFHQQRQKISGNGYLLLALVMKVTQTAIYLSLHGYSLCAVVRNCTFFCA